MRRLLDLPFEILLIIYGSLASLKDAGRLSRCCRTLYLLFNNPGNQEQILMSIVIDVCLAFGTQRLRLLTLIEQPTATQEPKYDLAQSSHWFSLVLETYRIAGTCQSGAQKDAGIPHNHWHAFCHLTNYQMGFLPP